VLQILAAFAAAVEPGEAHPHVIANTLADRQAIARGANGLVDQGGGDGPVGVVERGPVQRRKDAVKGIERVHDTSSQTTAGRCLEASLMSSGSSRLMFSPRSGAAQMSGSTTIFPIL